MPPAVALAVPAVLGAGASASGGKKGRSSAQKAADRQFQLQAGIANKAFSNLDPAANYFKALLSGDPTQIAGAVGPTSDILKQQGQATSRQIADTTPLGGEAALAQTQNAQNTYNQTARLYAGVQPQAAQALAGLGQGELGVSAPNVGSGLKFDTHQQELGIQNKGALGQGIGALGTRAYQSKQGKRTGSGGGGGGGGGAPGGGGSSQKTF